jgi:hypothetical protein
MIGTANRGARSRETLSDRIAAFIRQNRLATVVGAPLPRAKKNFQNVKA